MTPTELADRYFAAVRARDLDAFTALFAEDATFVLPDGREIAGKAAIREMEAQVFAAGGPTPSPQSMFPGGEGIAVQVEVRLADDSVRRMGSFFHLGADGLIRRLSIYRQG
ncbi:nuclear transport factor 2 family protein [Sphingomonas sp. SUN039]|uniref:nuclear transport factor 2 family protein n=1 Tax=Sphingomonas sp. SUN039 TaxID=2937787 RepID=UPI00216424AD|nr:nuclear transport factor 2 family protein [Sphingomonas sp. SUN039]UVO52615.1 nuclear transport factor 2 family protein [Sphingomonas sp. SUN039]